MSFGISVGDFLAAATLIRDIAVCVKDSGGSASEYQELIDELHGLLLVLDKIEHLEGSAGQAEAIASIKVAALNCNFVLQDFRRKLEPYDKSLDRGKTRGWAKDSTRKVRWELTMKTEVQNLRAYLLAHTSSLNMRLSIEGLATASAAADQAIRNQEILEQKFDDTLSAIFDVQIGITSLELQQKEEKREKVLDWLSLINMYEKQHDTLSRRQENTGDWLFEKKEFLDWLENDDSNSALWCPGNRAGTGKTVMTSIVVDYIQKRYPSENIGIAFVYCDYKEGRATSELIATLARQLSERKLLLPQNLVDLYEELGRANKCLDLQQLQQLLLSLCGSFSMAFILVDALDECNIPAERGSFLSTIQALLDASVKTFITSRPNLEDIKTQFDDVPQVEIVATEGDIRRYLTGKMRANHVFYKRISSAPGLEDKILDAIVSRASGMFLMAVLQLDRVLAERTATKILKSLRSLPSKLEETYKETLVRIQNQPEPDNTLGMRVLQWISQSKRLLLVDELRHALAVEWEADEDPPRSLDVDNFLEPESLVDVCAGLVVIEKESEVIRLVHLTTQEFFLGSLEPLFLDADTQISKTCLAYLAFDVFRKGFCVSDGELDTRLQLYPFLNYAAHYWGDHLRGNPERGLESMALYLLNSYINLTASVQVVYTAGYRYEGYSQNFPENMRGLHLASIFGLRILMAKLLLEESADVDSKDSKGRTPLSLAAENGHETIITLLLKHGAEVNSKDSLYGQAPLSWAAKNGHKAVVTLLLEWGAEVDPKDSSGRTPLFWAARNRHKAVVTLLLEQGAEVDSKDISSRTPLSLTAEKGHESVVTLLLKQNAEVDSKDKNGQTPLLWAARNGHKAVVRLLLEQGAEVDSKDTWYSQTPLSWAAHNGHEAVVMLMLKLGAEVDSKDSRYSQTPLSWAAEKGHEAVVKLLLEQGAEVDSKDKNGQTPLLWAAKNGHKAVVTLLLEQGAEVDSKDSSGRTPLLCAARYGHKAAVTVLLKQGAEVDFTDSSGRTPLLWAATNGHEAVMTLLQLKS